MNLSKLTTTQNRKTILAADDQEGQRLLLDLMLSVDYELILLKDGREVLEYLRVNKEPDLIILDVEMPQVNGLDVCSRIKQVGRLKQIPVMILTSNDDDQTKILAEMSKADSLVYKPLSGKDFSSIVSNLLKKIPQA